MNANALRHPVRGASLLIGLIVSHAGKWSDSRGYCLTEASPVDLKAGFLRRWRNGVVTLICGLACSSCVPLMLLGHALVLSYPYENNQIHHEYGEPLGKVYEVAKEIRGALPTKTKAASLADKRATIEATLNDGREVRILLEALSENRTCATFSVGAEESYGNRNAAVALAIGVRRQLGSNGSDIPGGPRTAGCPPPPKS